MHTDEKYQAMMQREEEEGLLNAYEDHNEPRHRPCQQKKKPMWRRMVQVVMMVMAVGVLWMAVSPMLSKCGYGMGSRPEHLPSNRKLHGDELNFKFDNDLKSFYIKQGRQSTIPSRTVVYGKVVLASHQERKVDHITVDFDIHVSDKSLLDKIKIEPKEDGIIFSPDVMSIQRQYINVTAFVYLPNKKFDDLMIDVTQLDIEVEPSFTMPIKEVTLMTVTGSVTANDMGHKPVNADKLAIRTVNGRVTGQFALIKDLHIDTTSGNIDVDVKSADMKEVEASLKTRTVSGKTFLTFPAELHARPLKSLHESVSGNVHLRYPTDWQGVLKLETTSGVIDVFGKGTKVIKKEKDIAGKFWKVIKGDGDSDAIVRTVSGKIEVGVGRQQE